MRLAWLAAFVAVLELVMIVPASAAPKAATISANGSFGCAVMANHSVECWGYNLNGQLGNGSTTESAVPVHVHGIMNALSVSAGTLHACALLDTGRIKCWGNNFYGELGDGTTTESNVPVYVSGILHATKVSAGDETTCALLSEAAKCWGYNRNGELGDGSTTDSHVPVQVSGMKKNVTWISSGGDYFTCAVQSGVAKCWGYNATWGQLGDGTTVDSHVPHKVYGLGTHTILVNAGYYQACALQPTTNSGNALFCWGYNGYGELGNGSTTNSLVPVSVSGMQRHVTSISSNVYFTCAVQSGAAKCWGYNAYGQIGDGTTTDRHLPRQVVGLMSGVVKVSANVSSACALLMTGAAKCWGQDTEGELGNNSTTDSLVPVRVHLT